MMIYVSSPITGHDARNEPAFRRIAEVVRRQGHTPVVPLDIPAWSHDASVPCPAGYDIGGGHSSACWLRGDLAWLLRCDALIMLHGWEKSRGARLEWAVATECGLQIFYPHEIPPRMRFADVYLPDSVVDPVTGDMS